MLNRICVNGTRCTKCEIPVLLNYIFIIFLQGRKRKQEVREPVMMRKLVKRRAAAVIVR